MTTSPYTFADLSTTETQGMIRARLVAALAAAGQPTASWAPSSVGGVENLRLDMVAGGLAQWMARRYAAAVRGRMLFSAVDDDVGSFLTYLGKKNYQLQLIQPTFTVINVLIQASPKASTTLYKAGTLTARAPATGNRYVLQSDVQVTAGEASNAAFVAENPGAAYADGPGTVTQLVTAKAGVTVTNVPQFFEGGFRPTTATGTSTGSMTPTLNGAVDYSLLVVRIDLGGAVTIAKFSVSVDGGLSFGPSLFTAIAATLVAPNTFVAFSDGLVGTSLVAGSFFYARVDSAFLSRGRDVESPPQFQQACSDRWPALSLVPVKGTIELWAREASPEVTKVGSKANPNVPGGMLVTIASQTGPASPAAQGVVQAFIRARLGFKGIPAPISPTVPGSLSPEETVIVAAAEQLEVTAVASVYVPRSQMAAVQAAADEAWNEYLSGVPLGGNRGSSVELEAFYRILGDLGAIDVQTLTLNGVASDLAVPHGFDAVPAVGYTLLKGLNWVPT